jgi:hypothetical protein
MSLSLSQLFEQHQSQQSSSKPKKEESHELVDGGGGNGIGDGSSSINRFMIDSVQSRSTTNITTRKRSKKRERSSIPWESKNNSADNVDDKEQLTTKTKRIKSESSNDVKKEHDEKIESDILDTEDYEEEEDAGEDGAIDNTGNHRFYENYQDSAKVLYNFKNNDSEPPIHSKVLEVLHSALFPRKNKGALAIGNERRLAGDYDNEGGEDDAYASKSVPGRYRPRKRRVTTKAESGKIDLSYRLETQTEIEDRVQQMEGYTERSAIRERWKKRNANFQSEEDIGDAFLLRAQQDIGEKLRASEKERRMKERKEKKALRKEREKEERKKIKELETSDPLEEDDEVKEQSQLLAQLSQPDAILKQEGKDSLHPVSLSSNSQPQKLNYWELGYAMPKKASISYDFDPSVEKMVQSGSKGALETGTKRAENNHNAEDETKASFCALMFAQNEQRHSSRYFFETKRTFISNGNTTFRPGYRSGHIHQMLSMAARSLCSGSGSVCKDEVRLENDYLRLLCLRYEDSAKKRNLASTICADFRKRGYLTALADDQGQNMLLYLQNVWDDPTEVAKQLGILDCFQESPIRGNLLTNLKTHSEKNRSQIKKLHKIRSINWNHDNDSGDIESDHEDLDEELKVPSDEKIIAEVTTSDGVVDAMTLGTSLTIDKKGNFAPSKDERDAFISPNILYSHISGTRPPIPQYPTDPSAWMFGSVDRYSKFYHISVRMDSSIYKIMLSTLMKRIGRARISKNEQVSYKTQEQILNLIEEFSNINENKFYLRYTNSIQDPLDSDIPLVEFYRGVAGYCTYMANGYLEMHQPNKSSEGDEIYSPSHEYEDSQQGSRMSLIAGKIWECCRSKIRRNALMRFPKLRIVFGIALICRSLNPSAAEILSRPIDDDGISTPLDLFKQTLEDMESKKYIATNRNFEENSIRAVELEFLLHDAAEFFQEAVELEPTNVEFQLWHIGCLASCLLISSGNKISDSVHVYPSQIKGTFMKYETVVHEVRPCMKKYEEVRIELSTAVRALFTLTKYQNSPRSHFAVSSLLEWGQVIGLLVGSELYEFLNNINQRHTFHFGVWADHEPTTFLREYEGVPENICAKALYAQILENDPGEINNWRNFVLCLGPISNTKNHEWWGKDRCWWGDSILHISTPNVRDRVLIKDDSLILKNVLGQIKQVTAASSIPMQSSSVTVKIHGEYEDSSDDQNLDWLPTRENVLMQNDDQVNIPKERRTRCYANNLPRTRMKKNSISDKYDHTATFPSSISISTPRNPPLQDLSSISQEAQAYKILISCQLFGLDHPSVRKYIEYKMHCTCVHNRNNETVDENCDEFRVLVWLSSMGVNVEDIIQPMW